MLNNPLDKWIYFIKYASDLEEIPDIFKEDIFMHAFEKASVINMPKDEFELYEKEGMAVTDARGAIELAREEGKLEGAVEAFNTLYKEGLLSKEEFDKKIAQLRAES